MIVDPKQFEIRSPAKGFIVLEGVNGAGKSTLQGSLAQHLKDKGREVVVTREPGATKLGAAVRSLVLESKLPCPPLSELFLFAADRASHVEEVVKPALARGAVVLSDRYFYSTIAFQGYGRGLDLRIIDQLNLIATSGLIPDLILLLDLDPQQGLNRTACRSSSPSAGSDSFEDENIEFHKRIRSGFLQLAKSRPEPFVLIDASRGREDIFLEASNILDKVLLSRESNGSGAR